MTTSKITAMATLALALVLIGSVITGHLFVVYALLPNTPVIDYQKNTNTTTTTYTRAYRDQWTVLENSGNVHNNSFSSSTDQNQAASVNIQGNNNNNKVNIWQAEQSHQSFASGELDFTPGHMILDSPSGSNSGADNPRCVFMPL